MRVEQIVPALVAQLLGPRGRAHDVGEQHGRKDTVAFCRGDGDPVKNSSIASPICSWMKKR